MGCELNKLADLSRKRYVHELVLADYENVSESMGGGKRASTLASSVSLVKGFSEFLWERG